MPIDREPQPVMNLDDLLAAAMDKDWDAVDLALPSVCDNPQYVAWAISGIDHEDPNARDLAVSIFEKSKTELEPETAEKLAGLMERDKNPYVRFRSAFALFSHGSRSDEVIKLLHEALDDADVTEIAQGYLDQIAK